MLVILQMGKLRPRGRVSHLPMGRETLVKHKNVKFLENLDS